MRSLAQVRDFCPNRLWQGAGRVRQLLGENTADAESNPLTMRHFNGRLVGKAAPAFSKKVRMLELPAAWEDLYCHFVRLPKFLRKPSKQAGKPRWIQQTPALAGGPT